MGQIVVLQMHTTEILCSISLVEGVYIEVKFRTIPGAAYALAVLKVYQYCISGAASIVQT